MLHLHFVFAPHHDELSVLKLSQKLSQLSRQGKKVAFIGWEDSEALKKNREKTRQFQAEYNSYLNGTSRSAIENFKKDSTDPEAMKTYGNIIREKFADASTAPDGQQMHSTHMYWLAHSYNLPLEHIEMKTRSNSIKKKSLEERISKSMRYADNNPEVMIQRFTKHYYDDTHFHLSRHDDVAKNLVELCKKYNDAETEVHAVILFGRNHHGMEKYILERLNKGNIKAKLAPVELTHYNTDILDDLQQKRYANPKFKPSREEIARALLHEIIGVIACGKTIQALGEKHGFDIRQIQTLRLEHPLLNELSTATKAIITKMTGGQVMAVLKEKPSIGEFIERNGSRAIRKRLKLPEEISALKIDTSS